MNIVVLGATGMLGSMVYHYLKANPAFYVIGTSRKDYEGLAHFDVYGSFEKLSAEPKKIDYVINCIGITKPYCHDDNNREIKNAVYINSYFPYLLSESAEKNDFKIIQIATDCVYSGRHGNYLEDMPHDPIDMYGKTKSLGEVKAKYFLNIRSSIIGPERFNKVFLLEWFFTQKKGSAVNGFSHHLWNGVTTLQFAKLCEKIITGGKFDILTGQSSVHHFIPNNTVSKYELLRLFDEVFEKGVAVNKKEEGVPVVDRTLGTKYAILSSVYPPSTMREALMELKGHISKTGFYNV